MENDLKKTRHDLFATLNKTHTAESLLDYQLVLADEMKRCERLQRSKKDDCRKNHMHLLRCYGDTLAWQYLHSHTIRQLSKNPKTSPYLIDQEIGFNNTVTIAKGVLQYELPVLIADLTNCIRIGDLIVVTNPESPVILECKSGKSKPEFEYQGRRGRQISRMKGTIDYLNKGVAKVFGEETTRLSVEIECSSHFNWQIVDEVLEKAESNGQGYVAVSEYEIIGAVRSGIEFRMPDELHPEQFRFISPIVAAHYRVIEEA